MSWSDLPAGLVAVIADELTDLADLARFRSVCPSWRSATVAHAARLRVPLLLLPTEGSRGFRRVWPWVNNRLREIPVPAALGHAFLFASCQGWMLAVAHDLTASLVYPSNGDSAGLPMLPFSSSNSDDYEKVIRDLVWDWSPHGVVVSLGKGEGAFFCRPGDQSWRPVGCSSAGAITSITYCQGSFYLFYGGTCTGTVVDAETQAVVAEITRPPNLETPWQYFEANLVVSPDELLLLVRTQLLHTAGYMALSSVFKAFQADRAAGGGLSPSGWSELVGGIGDRAVFVDHFRAFCIEADGVNGVGGNCMYFASAHKEVNGIDMCGRYTVELLDLDDLSKGSLWHGNLLNERCSWFQQWPSWSLPKLH